MRSLLESAVVGAYRHHVHHALSNRGYTVDTHLAVVLDDGQLQNRTLEQAMREAYAPVTLSAVSRNASDTWRPQGPCTDLPGDQRQRALFLPVMRQWFALGICYEAISAHEQRVGQPYSWLIRLRTDMVPLAPIPLAGTMRLSAHAHVPVGGMIHAEQYRCLNDHVFICPRALCRSYFMLLELWSSSQCIQHANVSTRDVFASEDGRAPSGQLGPPTAQFSLPQAPFANTPPMPDRVTAQWYVLARYATPPAMTCAPGVPDARCCGLLRTVQWPYAIRRSVGNFECALRVTATVPWSLRCFDAATMSRHFSGLGARHNRDHHRCGAQNGSVPRGMVDYGALHAHLSGCLDLQSADRRGEPYNATEDDEAWCIRIAAIYKEREALIWRVNQTVMWGGSLSETALEEWDARLCQRRFGLGLHT